jgi:hypothetical protein
MTLKIEAGKYYRTRSGRKAGPARWREGYFSIDGWHYNAAGKCGYDGKEPFDRYKHDIIAEWTDEPAPKLWKDMTDEERVDALYDGLKGCPPGTTGKDRIKLVLSSLGEVRPEPKRETVTLTGANFGTANLAEWKWSFRQSGHIGQETHRITFDLIDGEPDPASIRIERL